MNYIVIRHLIKENFGNKKFILRKIQRYDTNFFVFELYSKDKGNIYLYVILGKCIGVFNVKPDNAPEPDSFVMRLRKDFRNKLVMIKQLWDERAIEIVDDNEDKIIIEIFKPGNIIVVNKDNKIRYALRYKDFGSRKILRNEIYKIVNPFSFPRDYGIFKSMVKNSNKRDLVRFLAIDLRLGGEFSEAILEYLNIDKTIKPNSLDDKIIERLYNTLLLIYDNIRYLEDILHTKLNEILTKNCKYENVKIKLLEARKKEIERILNEQIKLKEEYSRKAELYRKIGEFIKNYSWILSQDMDIVKKFFSELGIDVEIKKEGKEIILKIKEEDLNKLI